MHREREMSQEGASHDRSLEEQLIESEGLYGCLAPVEGILTTSREVSFFLRRKAQVQATHVLIHLIPTKEEGGMIMNDE